MPSAIHAATVISPGVNLSWNEVWTKENSPHVIEGPTQVRFGSLSIGSGTVVKFAADSSLRLHGNVVVTIEGTAPDPVYFTSIHDDSVGGDTNGDGSATAPAPGVMAKLGS